MVLSILNQDYDDFEVIVADDASTDDTGIILDRMQNDYPDRLKIIRHPKNIGLVENCNSVLPMCTGDYLCITGGDDIYLPGKLRKQIEFMQLNSDCILSYHQVEAFDSASNRHLYYFTEKIIEGSAEDLVQNGMEFLPLGAMFTNTKNMPNFRTGLPIASDWLFCIEHLVRNQGKFRFMPGIYARYRRHASNITNTSNNTDNWKALNLLSETYPELKDAVERFRSRLTITEYRAGRLSLNKLMQRFISSPRSFAWAFAWLFNTRLRHRWVKVLRFQEGMG